MTPQELVSLEIIAIALFASLAVFLYNKKTGSREKMKAVQQEINEYQKKLKQAQAEKNEKKVKELLEQSTWVNQKMSEMMGLSMKTLFITAPLYLALVWFVIPAFFNGYIAANLPFSVPVNFTVWEAGSWRNWLGARGVFIYATLVFGLVIEFGLTNVQKLFEKKSHEKKGLESVQ